MVTEKVSEILGPDAGRFSPTRLPVRPATGVATAGRRIGLVVTGVI
jgi:hypothetical protein